MQLITYKHIKRTLTRVRAKEAHTAHSALTEPTNVTREPPSSPSLDTLSGPHPLSLFTLSRQKEASWQCLLLAPNCSLGGCVRLLLDAVKEPVLVWC